MKFISWNVNGLRACVKKGFLDFVEAEQPDFLCVQETKLQEGQIDLQLDGYYQYWNYAVKKGYSGTAIFTKHEPLQVTYGLNIAEHDQEGRVITLEYNDFYLVTVYTPNSQNELARLDYRLTWEEAFRNDLKNPKTNTKNAGFTIEERNEMTKLLNSGFIDTFRYFYPTKENCYSWWSYRAGARAKNVGWRIDYFITSKALESRLEDARIYPDVLGSDHCPVGLQLKK